MPKKPFLYTIPFVVVATAWWSYAKWLPYIQAVLDPKADLVKLGTFGDSFGAFNALFSSLAFAALMLSIYLQSQELHETREEVTLQRKQQTKQVFESSFFQLLELSNEISFNITYKSYLTESTSVGKNCFAAIRADFVSDGLMSSHSSDSTEERYETFFLLHAHSQLGHYFRNLYQVFKLISAADVDDKKFYSNIVRAQLSSDELYLLFYNALSRFGREKFFPILRDFEFFEHLPVTEDVFQKDAEKFGIKAFGSSPEWKSRFAPRTAA